MGKKGGTTNSWLTAVKRAFRSPIKDSAQQRHFIANSSSFKRNRAAKIIQTAFRGYLRRQASMTMKRMEALLRVQARVQDQRARLVMDSRRRSMFAETNNLFDSKYPRTLEELEAILKARNEAVTKNQQWESRSRTSIDYKRASIKTVETESLRSSINGRRSHCQSPVHRHSTAHTRPRSPQVRAASPCRTPHEDRSHSTANTPSMRSTQRWNSSISRYSTSTNDGGIPNYMAATESAKARIRSQSAPRQRPSTPEKERGGSVKKRLSYPVPDPYSGFGQNLRSPSFKSVQARYLGMEEQSNYSCYTESIGGEISPCSTTDLRRWLR